MDGTNYLSNMSEYRRYAIVYHIVELVGIFAQIVTAFVVVAHVKGDPVEAKWLTAYAWGCIASLPFQIWRLLYTQDAASTSEIGINAVLLFVQMLVEYFFLIWSVVFLWVFVGNSPSLDSNTQLFWTCVVFLAFGFIRYVIPLLICGAICCCTCVLLSISAAS